VLLVADVDGTLLSQDGKLFPGARDLFRLRDFGVHAGIASARPVRGVQGLVRRLGGVDFACCLQGAHIVGADLTTDDATLTLIDRRAGLRIRELAEAGLNVWAYTADRWLVSGHSRESHRESQLIGFEPDGLLDERPRDDVLKYVCFGSGPLVRRLRKVARSNSLSLFESIYSDGHVFTEVVSSE
jgi:hydroxymethylpyrimidine pyrophosphatase-like HAD family hydrolase